MATGGPGDISIGLTSFEKPIGQVVAAELLRVKNLRDELENAIQLGIPDYITPTIRELRAAVGRLDDALTQHNYRKPATKNEPLVGR